MWFYSLVFFPFLSLIYLVIAGFGIVYFYMGVVQLATGFNEKNEAKRSGGALSVFISLAVIAFASYCYFKWIWLW